jgi:hypothetical protein
MEYVNMDEREAGTESSQKEAESESKQNQSEEEKLEGIPSEEELDAMEGQAGDALAWLEGPAFDSPIEEMPTLQWPDVEAEANTAEGQGSEAASELTDGAAARAGDEPEQETDELEDAMQWLEGLAEEQGTPLDEMPTLISGEESEPAGAAAMAAAIGMVEMGDTTPPPELDSDPMAWLEQLAIDQNSPLEELPSVADRLLASEIVSQATLNGDQELEPLDSQPVELEAALLYLEEQAAAQGVSLDNISLDDIEPVDSLDEDLGMLDRMVAGAAAAAAGKLVVDSLADEIDEEERDGLVAKAPEDSDESLAWFTELAEEETSLQESPAEESDKNEVEDGSLLKKGAAVVGTAQVAQAIMGDEEEAETETELPTEDEVTEPDVSSDIPDDPDEAMVWMSELAEEESADGQEVISTLDGKEGEEADGSILRKGAAVVGAAQVAQAVMGDEEEAETETELPTKDEVTEPVVLGDMPDDPDEAMVWMGELAEEESAGGQEVVSTLDTEQGEEADGSILRKGAAVVGTAHVAKSLMDGYEASESESVTEVENEAIDPEILEGMPEDPDEAMVWMAGLAAQEGLGSEAPDGQEETAEEAVEELGVGQREEFVKARAALSSGDVMEAVKQYRVLIDGEHGGRELIEELETAAAEKPAEPELQQLLGDAYMQDGQMQKALKAYNKGIDL